ncbi:unnamed protein product, partial [Brassica oleracea var. botrytis]
PFKVVECHFFITLHQGSIHIGTLSKNFSRHSLSVGGDSVRLLLPHVE